MAIQGKRIAFILAKDFDDTEFEVPYNRLKEVGADATIVGLRAGDDFCGDHDRVCVTTDKSFDEVSVDDFDGLVIPGGYSPDKLRLDDRAVSFVRDFVNSGKTVGAICHGPQILITAGVVKGRTLTCWPSIAVDLKNAGANYVDQQVVVDGNLVSSRNPRDAEAFAAKLIQMIGEELAAAA
ncbi:MAG: type 1 glutamine amidotransferase [Actinobacteria bacterium]|nr:type 1 glutamine amidotransferase [Actinomycetota bacterium]